MRVSASCFATAVLSVAILLIAGPRPVPGQSASNKAESSADTSAAGKNDQSTDNTVTIRVDTDRSSLSFTSKAPAEKIVGTTEQLDGVIDVDLDNLESVSGTIRFPVKSVSTGNSTRDEHLQQKDWLYAEKYPYVSFTIDGIEIEKRTEKDGRIDLKGRATGTVQMRGVSKTKTADIQVALLPDKKKARIQFQLQADVTEHGVEGRDGALGTDVAEVVDIEGTIYGSW
ncbi:MAG: YceI family protein [Bradymonadaceae bacterium]